MNCLCIFRQGSFDRSRDDGLEGGGVIRDSGRSGSSHSSHRNHHHKMPSSDRGPAAQYGGATEDLWGTDDLRKPAILNNHRSKPFKRMPSNVTTDSGRSSYIDNEEIGDNVVNPDATVTAQNRNLQVHSPTAVDSQGHLLRVPTPTETSPGDTGGALKSGSLSNYNTMSSSGRKSPSPSQTSSVSKSSSHVRHAPKIVYSHSEERLTTTRGSRPIFPSLPYSPYGSPTASPRLRRQPTRESRSVSISDSDGYTQLNQYKLKDEIGKVS